MQSFNHDDTAKLKFIAYFYLLRHSNYFLEIMQSFNHDDTAKLKFIAYFYLLRHSNYFLEIMRATITKLNVNPLKVLEFLSFKIPFHPNCTNKTDHHQLIIIIHHPTTS